jgi:hypothetical protein
MSRRNHVRPPSALLPAPPLRPKPGSNIPRPPRVMAPGGDDCDSTPPEQLPMIRTGHSKASKANNGKQRSEALEELNGTLRDAPPFFRTFDKSEGRVVLHSSSEIPDPEKLTQSIFKTLGHDAYEVEQAELRVTKMTEHEQVCLAAMAFRRKAQRLLQRTIRKGLMDRDAALVRTQQTLLADFNDAVSHLGTDTQELSLIRVHNAATEEVLFQKAQYMAKLELDRFKAVVISDDVTPTDILSFQIDAYRHKNVAPFPPRKKRSELELPILEGRRRSSDRGGVRTGIHSIVEKQLHALHR